MKYRVRGLLIIVAVFVSLIHGAAFAATIQHNLALDPLNGQFPSGGFCDANHCTSNFTYRGAIDLPTFDITLGQLTSVAFEMTYSRAITGSVNCTSDCPSATWSGTLGIDIYLGPSGIPSSLLILSDVETRIRSCLQACDVTESFRQFDQSVVNTDLDLFFGTGFVDVEYAAADSLRASGANLFASTSSLGFVATYNFEPVPEPSSAVLLAVGLLGLAGRRSG